VFDPLQFLDRGSDVFGRDDISVLRVSGHHGGVAQRIHETRDTARVSENDRVCVGLEYRTALRPGDFETMLDVGDRVGLRQRRQVEAQSNALRELYETRRIEFVVELGLARKDDAQHFLFRRLHAGEKPNFLEHLVREILCLVDDQQYAPPVCILLDQELVQGREQLGLFHSKRLKAELHEQRLQELDSGNLRLVDLRDDDILLELLEKGFDQGRLARADLARNDDEAVREPDRRFHVRFGARMVLRQIQECRVRGQPERQLL